MHPDAVLIQAGSARPCMLPASHLEHCTAHQPPASLTRLCAMLSSSLAPPASWHTLTLRGKVAAVRHKRGRASGQARRRQDRRRRRQTGAGCGAAAPQHSQHHSGAPTHAGHRRRSRRFGPAHGATAVGCSPRPHSSGERAPGPSRRPAAAGWRSGADRAKSATKLLLPQPAKPPLDRGRAAG